MCTRAGVCRLLSEWMEGFTADTATRIRQTGLSHLPSIMHDHLDFPLISAFVERWQSDTNTFHLPFGEMTIMLHDVYHILGIRVEGDMVAEDLSSDRYRTFAAELLQLATEELQVKTQTAIYRNGGIHTDQIFDRCRTVETTEEVQVIGYMWVLLGNTLFTDKSGCRTHPSFLTELFVEHNLERLTRYSWGSATLAYLYRQLGHATRNGCDSIAGCLTLLQSWIYEYFPCFRPHQGVLTRDVPYARAGLWDVGMARKHQQRLVSFRTRLDQLGDHEVCWLPYGAFPALQMPRTAFTGCIRYRGIIEPYMPGRVVR
ncbi:protein MAIN-LIKE 1-like [Chenopodium quinoa]|uniref:protein MAIN-LIKE 1-like n=1 Tax=Chenopodium quinoa TaxID=63459 RepID=UPI000B799E3B|nr:protein MAIN-LIKE 1-like [Chenopodium quinoa]